VGRSDDRGTTMPILRRVGVAELDRGWGALVPGLLAAQDPDQTLHTLR